MFSREKKVIFPFILLRLFDPEGLGAGTRRPLVPQEVARLQRRSSSIKTEMRIINIQKQQCFRNAVFS
ncbi:hypothetical protein ACQCVP_10060 [Rossellomorea vietnamensis]